MGMPAASNCHVPLGILGSVSVQELTNSMHIGRSVQLYRPVLIAFATVPRFLMPVVLQPSLAATEQTGTSLEKVTLVFD